MHRGAVVVLFTLSLALVPTGVAAAPVTGEPRIDTKKVDAIVLASTAGVKGLTGLSGESAGDLSAQIRLVNRSWKKALTQAKKRPRGVPKATMTDLRDAIGTGRTTLAAVTECLQERNASRKECAGTIERATGDARTVAAATAVLAPFGSARADRVLADLQTESTTPPPPPPPNPPSISLDEYNQIQVGMNLDQLVAIIGSQPASFNEIAIPNIPTTTYYLWNGANPNTSASVGFQDGVVANKFQIGLI